MKMCRLTFWMPRRLMDAPGSGRSDRLHCQSSRRVSSSAPSWCSTPPGTTFCWPSSWGGADAHAPRHDILLSPRYPRRLGRNKRRGNPGDPSSRHLDAAGPALLRTRHYLGEHEGMIENCLPGRNGRCRCNNNLWRESPLATEMLVFASDPCSSSGRNCSPG